QLVYERAVRDGEHRPVDEVFALDHPWVDLVDLRRRLARIETVTDVEILPVELKQPPDPGAVFRAAKIGLPRGFAWDGDDTPDVRARVRATVGRLPGAIQRRLPSAVRPRPQVA